jgi:hypothetical protein
MAHGNGNNPMLRTVTSKGKGRRETNHGGRRARPPLQTQEEGGRGRTRGGGAADGWPPSAGAGGVRLTATSAPYHEQAHASLALVAGGRPHDGMSPAHG